MSDVLAPPPLGTAHLPGIGGRIKSAPEDFEVEEVPAYEPCGSGEHLFLWIEKRGLGAEFFARRIARLLNLPPGEVGTAGLKDRHAVTRQWVSVPDRCEEHLARLDGDGIRLLATSRHTNKLKPGHLRGNRFRILVRDPDPEVEGRLPALVEYLQAHGMPNFYGPQRFGTEGETARIGLALLRKEPPPVSATGHRPNVRSPFLRKLALSAGQSVLFNRCLARRLADGLLRCVLEGDVMAHWPRGGLFVAEDLPREQQRLDSRETVPTGPMYGRKMYAPAGEAARREAEVLAEAGLSTASFAAFGKLLAGTRRHNLIHLDDLTASREPEGVRIGVTLPSGSYATVLLRELMHAEPAESPEESPG